MKIDRELLRKKKKNARDLDRIKNLASLLAIRFFESAGLDIVYDGEQRRSEMYQYPTRFVDGLEPLGHVRIFDNKYFNMTLCANRIGLRRPYHVEEFKFAASNTNKELKVPITGAATIAYWTDNHWYFTKHRELASNPKFRMFAARRDFLFDVAKKVIRPNLQALVRAGAKRIQIDEPAAAMHTGKEDLQLFVDASNESVKGIDAKISLHICFSDYQALVPEILDMKKCDQLTLEFANRDDARLGTSKEDRTGYRDLELFREYGHRGEVGLGVVNVHTDFVPSPELVRDRILYASRILDSDKIFVNPDCGLRTRRWPVAYDMLKNMVKGAELASKVLSRS